MLDLSTEQTVSLAEACRLLPAGRNGRPVHLSCLLRWIIDGAKGPDGNRVRLDAARIGSRWITSREALQRFAERLTPRLGADSTPTPRTQSRRQRQTEAAQRELAKMGI